MAVITASLTTWSIYLYLIPVLIGLHVLRNYVHHGLNRYPGPFWAHITNVWRYLDVRARRPEVTHLALHRRYGDVVRLGPNVLSFADPGALKVIYGLNKGFVKSEFYPVQMSTSKGEALPSLFSTRDEAFHAELRRSVNHAFSMSSLVRYEPLVDETTALFLDQTARIYASSSSPKTCDFARWLQFFAFDVIGSITYGQRHGFLERNEDVDGIIGQLGRIFDYAGPVGQMPWLDRLLWKNPIWDFLSRWGLLDNSFAVAVFARERLQERLTSEKTAASSSTKHDDLLTMFLKARDARPEFMTEKRVLTMAVSMAFAGSETTAISLAAVFYHLLKNPPCLQRLRTEIDSAVDDGTIEQRGSGLVSWSESQRLPYLDACIKEAFRLHPAAGLPLERVVPAAGVDIAGRFIAGGTIVGCSAWVLHRREDIFGPDVDTYNPDRWLAPSDDVLKTRNATLFHFGAGSRTCIGKNISLMEIYKLVPSFLRRFDVQLAHPEQEWRLHNAWFVRQLNFETTFKEREIKA